MADEKIANIKSSLLAAISEHLDAMERDGLIGVGQTRSVKGFGHEVTHGVSHGVGHGVIYGTIKCLCSVV